MLRTIAVYCLTGFSVAFLLGCGAGKKVSPEIIGEGDLKYAIYVVGGYELQFKPTLVDNAMPMSSGERYLIASLHEVNGRNIQNAFGLTQITIHSGVTSEKYDIGEMSDFGTESPTLEGVVRKIRQNKTPLDKVILHFIEISTGEQHSIEARNVYSTIAY